MSAQHTPGRVEAQIVGLNQAYLVAKVAGRERAIAAVMIGADEGPHNLRRLGACWNACEGISTEVLENVAMLGDTLADRFKLRDQIERDLSTQRDQLLAACRQAEPVLADLERLLQARAPGFDGLAALQAVRQAIAKAAG